MKIAKLVLTFHLSGPLLRLRRELRVRSHSLFYFHLLQSWLYQNKYYYSVWAFLLTLICPGKEGVVRQRQQCPFIQHSVYLGGLQEFDRDFPTPLVWDKESDTHSTYVKISTTCLHKYAVSRNMGRTEVLSLPWKQQHHHCMVV